MKLNKIVLDNFRCFEHLEMEFDNRLTVIVGGNGAGKTAILDSIRLLLGQFPALLPQRAAIQPEPSDLRILDSNKLSPAFQCYVEASIDKELTTLNMPVDSLQKWGVLYWRDDSPTTRDEVAGVFNVQKLEIGWMHLASFANYLIDFENKGKPYQLPLMIYYGTNRAMFDSVIREYDPKAHFRRFNSLSDALNPTASFKNVFNWFHAKENEELREGKKLKSTDYKDPSLEFVRHAITEFFNPQFQNPRTEVNPLRFLVDWKNGDHYIPLDLKQLSDGYRTTLALIADLARRMVEANPPGSGIDDPLNTEAIVLIDEVDLHLHPEWQQRILKQLLDTFPKAQFIVTTHSPQVLSTVPAECIRIIHDGRVFGATWGTEGAESARVLKQIFGVESRPLENEFTQKLFKYRDLVYNDQWESDEAMALRKELDAHFRQNEPLLLELDLYIENRQWELAE